MATSVSLTQITTPKQSLLSIYLDNHPEISKKYHAELLNYEKDLFTILDIHIYWKTSMFSNNLLKFLDQFFHEQFATNFTLLDNLTGYINELCIANSNYYDPDYVYVSSLYILQYMQHVSYNIVKSNHKRQIENTYSDLIKIPADLYSLLPRHFIRMIVNEMPQKNPDIMVILNSI
jgi:hypothetical protein